MRRGCNSRSGYADSEDAEDGVAYFGVFLGMPYLILHPQGLCFRACPDIASSAGREIGLDSFLIRANTCSQHQGRDGDGR
jgi:hypothetical protein